ncbi:MAG: hypothetical protein HYX44_00910 [Aquabacterium sp.]|nr:hypothetical protein [Aquabacterium sp.]
MPTQAPPPAGTPYLEGASLESAFPFFVLLDPQLTIVRAGAAIMRAVPGLAKGQSLLTHLLPVRPKALLDTCDWLQYVGAPLVLNGVVNQALRFRGQMCPQHGTGILLLLSPVVNRFEDLLPLNISLSDLAPHDATGDMLMLNKVAQTSFDDAQRMATRLRQRGRQLQLMTELSGHGIAYFSPSGDLQQSNPLLAQLLEWPDMCAQPRTEAMIERQLQAITRPQFGKDLRLHNLAKGGAATEKSQASDVLSPCLIVQTLKGRYLKLNYETTDAQAHVLFVRDVTAETLIDRMKSEFMSTAAHELRTPMTSIYGFSELLVNRTFSVDQAHKLAQTIHKQASWMISLLNKLLDLARIEARQGQDFDIETLSMGALLEEVMTSYCDTQTRPRITIHADEPCPTIEADRIKAAQAIGNVLSNALKYSPDGGPVTVSYGSAGREGTPGVRIEITDKGIGMSPEQLARVFERFYRADPSCNIPGSGLGMSLVQQIMSLLGGHIDIQSQLGHGTQVMLWFPASKPQTAARLIESA